jgi:tetracycline resistance efflux pump
MENTIFSLLPPVVAIVMAILTRRVILSLGVGIVLAGLLLGQFQLGASFTYIWEAFSGIFISDGEINTWNVYILIFLLILGVITAFINISGGSRAFGEWALKRVKSRVGAQLVTAFLGIIIFIDDYFNSLAVGQVARPITDRQKVSRAKLAYLIDSTSAPVCVVSPISSWGAYIIGIIGMILAEHSITEYTAFSAFMQMVPLNIYVWVALAFVFLVAIRNVNIGAMKQHEERAIATGEVYDPEKEIPGEVKEELPVSQKGTIGDLLLPILALIVGTVVAMIWTGAKAVEGEATILAIFENTDVATSLVYGGLFGLLVTILLFIRQSVVFKGIPASVFGNGVWAGIRSMLPAINILILAWTIVTLIDQLQTGTYLAGLVEKANINTAFLPAILFLVAGIMAFSTGTSWGSFGLLLPIAGEITAVTDMTLLLPSMAAVLAGAVFGDHCSPISDTTILSSTGAGSNHMDHVVTQLPYTLIAAVISTISYIVIGFFGSTIIGLFAAAILFVIVAVWLQRNTGKQTEAVEA